MSTTASYTQTFYTCPFNTQHKDGFRGLAVLIVSVEINTTHRLFHMLFSENATVELQRKRMTKEKKPWQNMLLELSMLNISDVVWLAFTGL